MVSIGIYGMSILPGFSFAQKNSRLAFQAWQSQTWATLRHVALTQVMYEKLNASISTLWFSSKFSE
jgi:hypothetical protein